MNKRGQFFILAAVIISAVVVSMGVVFNDIQVNTNVEDIYGLSLEVQRESGEVIDYEVYGGFDQQNGDLDDFVGKLSQDIKNNKPGSEFMFIYGSADDMNAKNYGFEEMKISSGDEVFDIDDGSIDTRSKVIFRRENWSIENNVEIDLEDFREGAEVELPGLGEESVISFPIDDNQYLFRVSRYRQVLFVIKKEVGNESYIAIR